MRVFENSFDHHTAEYEQTKPLDDQPPQLIVRRGQTFKVTLNFDRKYKEKVDDVKVAFEFGT